MLKRASGGLRICASKRREGDIFLKSRQTNLMPSLGRSKSFLGSRLKTIQPEMREDDRHVTVPYDLTPSHTCAHIRNVLCAAKGI